MLAGSCEMEVMRKPVCILFIMTPLWTRDLEQTFDTENMDAGLILMTTVD
jgi:hypothetical protein